VDVHILSFLTILDDKSIYVIVLPYCLKCGREIQAIGATGTGMCPTCGFVNVSVTPIQGEPPQAKYCQYCGKEMPTGVSFCPSCGRPTKPEVMVPTPSIPSKPKSKTGRNIVIAIALIFLVLVVAALGSGVYQGTKPPPTTPKMSIDEIKSVAIKVPYEDLFRYNEQYIGKIIYFRGQTVQVVSGTGQNNYILRIATKENVYTSWYEDVIWVNYEGPRVLEKDMVDVWGRVKGLRSYTAVLGVEMTIPEVDSLHLEVVEISTPTPTPTSTPTPTPTPKQYDVVIRYAERYEGAIGYHEPDKGYTFLIITLDIENMIDREFSTNPYNFKVIINNVEYDHDWATYSLNDPLKGVDLHKGGRISGSIVFEVPAGTTEYKLVYEGFWYDWKIDWIHY